MLHYFTDGGGLEGWAIILIIAAVGVAVVIISYVAYSEYKKRRMGDSSEREGLVPNKYNVI